MTDDDKKQIESGIQNSRSRQIQKRPAGIALRTHHRVTEIKNTERRHPQRINTEIQDRTVNQFLFGFDQCQDRSGQGKTQNGNQ